MNFWSGYEGANSAAVLHQAFALERGESVASVRHNHWLGIRLVGKKCNPDAVGAKVTYQAGDLKRSRVKVAGGSYLSSHDPRMVLGLGSRDKMDWVEVTWPMPSGRTQRFINPPVDRYITIVEGEDKWK
jgi:enediyne biosynthesis protein E4